MSGLIKQLLKIRPAKHTPAETDVEPAETDVEPAETDVEPAETDVEAKPAKTAVEADNLTNAHHRCGGKGCLTLLTHEEREAYKVDVLYWKNDSLLVPEQCSSSWFLGCVRTHRIEIASQTIMRLQHAPHHAQF